MMQKTMTTLALMMLMALNTSAQFKSIEIEKTGKGLLIKAQVNALGFVKRSVSAGTWGKKQKLKTKMRALRTKNNFVN